MAMQRRKKMKSTGGLSMFGRANAMRSPMGNGMGQNAMPPMRPLGAPPGQQLNNMPPGNTVINPGGNWPQGMPFGNRMPPGAGVMPMPNQGLNPQAAMRQPFPPGVQLPPMGQAFGNQFPRPPYGGNPQLPYGQAFNNQFPQGGPQVADETGYLPQDQAEMARRRMLFQQIMARRSMQAPQSWGQYPTNTGGPVNPGYNF